MRMSIIKKGEPLDKLIKLIGSKRLPGVMRAVKISANTVMSEWVKAVRECSSKEGFKAQYIKSINIDRQVNVMEATVSAGGMFVNFVESGIRRFDMKPGLLAGPKARVNAKGEPYNIIFMRKGTPGTARLSQMPRNVYTAVKEMDKGEVQKRYRVIGVGDKAPLVQSTNLKQRIHSRGAATYGGGKKDIYKGMVKTGSPGHTAYGTFRIVSKNSKGWIHPGVPAAPVFDKLSARLEPQIKKILQRGLIQDIEAGVNFLKERGYR